MAVRRKWSMMHAYAYGLCVTSYNITVRRNVLYVYMFIAAIKRCVPGRLHGRRGMDKLVVMACVCVRTYVSSNVNII